MAEKKKFWFKHDFHARNHDRLKKLRYEFNLAGLGAFWSLVEMIAESPGRKLSLTAIGMLSRELWCEEEWLTKVIHFCITDSVQLFVADDQFFWSSSLRKRLKDNDVRSESARQSANMRWQSEPDAHAMRTHTERKASAVPSQSERNANRVEKSREEEEKREKYSDLDFATAQLLFSRMLENDPNAKHPNLEKWAEEIEKLHRIDGRDYEVISSVIDWCQKDRFWKANILSAKTLRDKFPKLFLAASESQPVKQTGIGRLAL